MAFATLPGNKVELPHPQAEASPLVERLRPASDSILAVVESAAHNFRLSSWVR